MSRREFINTGVVGTTALAGSPWLTAPRDDTRRVRGACMHDCPDIVIMLHGWWASRIGGSSANALTRDGLSDLGSGGSLHDTWVEVQKNG